MKGIRASSCGKEERGRRRGGGREGRSGGVHQGILLWGKKERDDEGYPRRHVPKDFIPRGTPQPCSLPAHLAKALLSSHRPHLEVMTEVINVLGREGVIGAQAGALNVGIKPTGRGGRGALRVSLGLRRERSM